MAVFHHRNGSQSHIFSLCRTLCIWTTWVQAAATLPQAIAYTDGLKLAGSLALIPSAPRGTFIIPSAPITSSPTQSVLTSSQSRSPGLIPSAPLSSSTPSIAPPPDPTSSSPVLLPSSSSSTGLIPSALPTQTFQVTTPGVLPSSSHVPTNGSFTSSETDISSTTPSGVPITMSTSEGLHPIPAPTTVTGDPNGHHEIPEPNFTITLPCRGCSPAIEITATGWDQIPTFPAQPPAQEQETKQSPLPLVTVTAGPSNILVRPNPSAGIIIGDSTTVRPGQTVIVDKTPIAIQTSSGRTEVIIGGTQTIPLPSVNDPSLPQATITIGPSNIPVKPEPTGFNFVIGDSTTIKPGQTITMDNTPIVVQTSAGRTQVIVGGTQTVPLRPGDMTDAPVLLPVTVGSQILTPIPSPNADLDASANPINYVIEGQTLLPGGPAITVSGTTLSLLPAATALVVNGQTTTLVPSHGAIYTTTSAAPLTLWGHVYTANRAGYYSLAPGTTLVPGGPPVTISGSVISLEPRGTAAIIQGSTSYMQPITTIVTVAQTSGFGGDGAGISTPMPLETGKVHSGVGAVKVGTSGDEWAKAVLVLGAVTWYWLTMWL